MGDYMKNIREYIKDDSFKMKIFKNKIYIENYINLGLISDSEITLYTSDKKISIKGKKLRVNKLLNTEILILGNYNNIIFKDKNE